MRWLALTPLLLLFPAPAEAFWFRLRIELPTIIIGRPSVRPVQVWQVVSTSKPAPLTVAPDDSVFVNQFGQAWTVAPIPFEDAPRRSSVYGPRTDTDEYRHPDQHLGSGIMHNPNYTVRRVYRNVEVTSYNSEQRQTDSTPWEIRTNFLVRFGDAACNFLPKGTLFRLPDAPTPFNIVVFRVEDETNQKYRHRIDLWLLHVRHAENWGVKHLTVEVLGPPRDEAPR